MVRVKPKVLTVEEANEQRLREEEHRVRLYEATHESQWFKMRSQS